MENGLNRSIRIGWALALAAPLASALALVAPLALAAPATAPVELRDVDETYAAEGVVEAIREATVAAQVQGRILELRAKAGDAVTRGQVLARIDEREAMQGVASGEAVVARAQADLSNATVNLERTRKLIDSKFVSPAALDKAQADYDAARAALAAAKATAGRADAIRSYTVITAPFSGVVAERPAELGEMAQPGKPLFVMFDPKDLRVVASVPQANVAGIRARASGATAEIPALGKTFKARTVTILPSADTRTHTTMVRLDLPESLAGAYPGMFARAHFATGIAKKLVIPAQAVAYRSEVAGAYVVNDRGEIRFRQLRLGESVGDGGIEVLAGVAAGERVALDPVAALAQLKQAAVK